MPLFHRLRAVRFTNVFPARFDRSRAVLGKDTLQGHFGPLHLDVVQTQIHTNGCFDEILPIIQQLITVGAILMLLICVILIITTLLTCLLSFEIRSTQMLVERVRRKRALCPIETRSEKKSEQQF
jgi:hypothetical protein